MGDPHQALAARPLFEAMVRGELPRPTYVTWLRVMAVVVDTVEQALDGADHADLASVWGPQMRTLPLLRADLPVFDALSVSTTSAIEPLLALVHTVRRWAREEPVCLLGVLYGLQGPMLGGERVHERLAERYGLTGAGLAYVSSYTARTREGPGARTGAAASLGRSLDALDPSEHATQQVIDAARRFVAELGEIVGALHPSPKDERPMISALNFDAGEHAVTQDPRELVAAVDAGERTWHEYPYYQARYGTRGRRFTSSDSAWLVTLASEPQSAQRARIDWLARLLAVRGMPSVLLEVHLLHLYEALVASVPERAAKYRSLEALGHQLRSQRLGALPQFDALVDQYPHDAPWPNMGAVLVGAVADERRGIEGAVKSVASWLEASDRLDAEQSASVERLIALARQSRA